MAKYTKKTEAEITNADVEIVEKTATTKSSKTTKKVEKTEKATKSFAQNELIPCRSIVEGGLYLEGARTKMPYEWSNYGAIEDVEYRDLAELVRTRSGYIFSPYLIVEDVDFVAQFPALEKFYNDNYTVKDLVDVLNLPIEQMKVELKALPKSTLETLKSIAASQVSSGEIDSVRKIKALDEFFGTDLSLLSEFTQ